jgi:hypothetical protein
MLAHQPLAERRPLRIELVGAVRSLAQQGQLHAGQLLHQQLVGRGFGGQGAQVLPQALQQGVVAQRKRAHRGISSQDVMPTARLPAGGG